MNNVLKSAIMLCMLVSFSYAIGLQHGLFRSQSTQGKAWQGTATITSEHYQLTVNPDYLDVELEWVFEVGGTEPDSFRNALEIVGNLNLENNATVVGMLVWYNGQILKAKLKTNSVARDQYEQVVERDAAAPPPPRDPVLLEMIRDDNYDISIFPVSFGGTRKVRMRYLIPGSTTDGVMKIGYPHAFTANATVEIRKGEGVEGYKIVTTEVPLLYTNIDFAELPRTKYAFQAYGSGGGESITSIIPVLPDTKSGSRFYMGSFSTDSFSGTMLHMSTRGTSDIILKTSFKEDFVVIWRWNHPDILQLYARQIVEQAGLLKTFFTALDQTSKRGALVISKQGGETVTFQLDKNGGDAFAGMLEYLTGLCSLPLPPDGVQSSTRLTAEQSQELAYASFEEFKTALQAAVTMLQSSDAQKHILILTAGLEAPISIYDTGRPESMGSDITIALFSSVCPGGGTGLLRQAWPGVNLSSMAAVADTSLKVFACVTNGTETDSFQTFTTTPQYYYGQSSANDRFLYSDKPFIGEITWKMYRGNQLVGEMKEQPAIIPIRDGMQYARCIGSLKNMMPLAQTMPSSIASTLGFIDMKYTLLALEEDILDPAIASGYENEGVPVLAKSDIFPAADEKAAIPVADWLKANPREVPQTQLWWGMMMDGAVRKDVLEVAVPAAGAARWANPAADEIFVPTIVQNASTYEVAPVRQSPRTKESGISLQIRQGYLLVNFGTLSSFSAQTEFVLYDLSGRVVMRCSLGRLFSAGGAVVQVKLPKVNAGMYLARLEKGGARFSQTIMIR